MMPSQAPGASPSQAPIWLLWAASFTYLQPPFFVDEESNTRRITEEFSRAESLQAETKTWQSSATDALVAFLLA